MNRRFEITSLLTLLIGLSGGCDGETNPHGQSTGASLDSDAAVTLGGSPTDAAVSFGGSLGSNAAMTLDAAAISDAAIDTVELHRDAGLLAQSDASTLKADAQQTSSEPPLAGEAGLAVETWCFGPDSNLARAYEPNAQGCDCATDSAPRCEHDPEGRAVGLECQHNAWKAVEDGPCAPPPPP